MKQRMGLGGTTTAGTATLLMAAGVDVKLIAQILGHSTVKITQDVYQHGDAVMLAGAMKALEAYVQEPTKGI